MSENNEVTREELARVIAGLWTKSWTPLVFPGDAAKSLLEWFVITRKPEPLPSEPDSLWLDGYGDAWQVDRGGVLKSFLHPTKNPEDYTPFRRLVVAE